MAPLWLRRLLGLPVDRVTKKTLERYRASFAQYVTVRTFHSNVRHWLDQADVALSVIQEDGVFDRVTHPMVQGLKTYDLELWFSDEDFGILPKSVWWTLMDKQELILDALNQTTPSTREYHRRMTKGLFDDLAVIEKALFDVEERYVKHKRNTQRYG